MRGIQPATAELVIARADGFCEACGGRVNTGNREAYSLHHRKRRQCGDHSAANLMLVHGAIWDNCHNLSEWSIHANPTRSHRLGHILYQNEDPELVPFETVRNLRELRA